MAISTSGVTIDRAVLALAGVLILASALLAWLVSPYWLFLAGGVGLMLLQASITGVCPAAILLRRLGITTGCSVD